jgi:carbonic anhydrase
MKNLIKPILASLIMGILSVSYAENADWDYHGDTAPAHWSSLTSDYALCNSGKNQSPIDIDPKTARNANKQGLIFNYGRLDAVKMSNTGKQLQIDVAKGASIKIEGIEFELQQMSFHIPSEHTYNQQHFPMEIQFLHQSKAGDIAYVSLMVALGKSSRTLRKLQQQLPMNAGESKQLTANALRNLEKKQKVTNYYRYSGSLTSPPCSEGVRWFIMNKPSRISQRHYQTFKQALQQNNNRPIQALHARTVLK